MSIRIQGRGLGFGGDNGVYSMAKCHECTLESPPPPSRRHFHTFFRHFPLIAKTGMCFKMELSSKSRPLRMTVKVLTGVAQGDKKNAWRVSYICVSCIHVLRYRESCMYSHIKSTNLANYTNNKLTAWGACKTVQLKHPVRFFGSMTQSVGRPGERGRGIIWNQITLTSGTNIFRISIFRRKDIHISWIHTTNSTITKTRTKFSVFSFPFELNVGIRTPLQILIDRIFIFLGKNEYVFRFYCSLYSNEFASEPTELMRTLWVERSFQYFKYCSNIGTKTETRI